VSRVLTNELWQLFTHGILQFQNECLGEVSYEAIPAIILMVGIFVSFLADYVVQQILEWRSTQKGDIPGDSTGNTVVSAELVNVAILEAGIIFHSLRKSTPTIVKDSEG
jgi:solute carrier family 39 (zinc transporter), member 1/2/3